MKTLLLFHAIFTLLAHVASAALYSFNNVSSLSVHGITDADGRAFRSGTTVGQELTATGTYGNWTSAGPGVVAFGFFSTDSLSGFTTTQLISAFTIFSTTGTFGAGPSGQRGTFAVTTADIEVTGSPFAGKNIYLFAGNGSTLATSTQFLVLKNSSQFLAADDDAPLAVTIQFLSSNSTLLLGTTASNVPTTNTDATVTPGWAMVAPIPETSTSLLGVLGGLVMLRRRRA